MDGKTTRRSLLAGSIAVPALLGAVTQTSARDPKHRISIHDDSKALTLTNGLVNVHCDKSTGLATCSWRNGASVKGIYSSADVGSVFKTTDFKQHISGGAPENVEDHIGAGRRAVLVHRSVTGPELIQHFTIYEELPFVLIRTEVRALQPLSTNYIGVVVSDAPGCVDIGQSSDSRVLRVPFDNDMWVRYDSSTINSSGLSCEVTAIYDNASRNGIVAGAVNHDIWKSGIRFAGADGTLNRFELFAGNATSGVKSFTHDTLPHGKITGTSVASPVMFLGFYNDWRDGLEEYGRVNSIFGPPLSWKEAVPFGWNSWAAYGGHIDYSKYLGCGKFIATKLAPNGFENGRAIYLNLDAFWSRLDASQLRDAVSILGNFSKEGRIDFRPGIYYTPFAQWGNDFDQFVEGTNVKYRYRDILLRAPDGSPLPRIAAGAPLDPTHPGTQARIRANIDTFKKLGFRYVKLDFLSHGSLEGVHWNKSVHTGIQAYNQGMKCVVDEVAGQMFISLSIAPLFPAGCGHARRISCDTMGHIDGRTESTEYMLNSLTYGWWTNRSIYIADPDEVPLGPCANKGARNENEARSRFLSAIISGGMVLDSSEFLEDATARSLAEAVYTSRRVNALAGGKAFRPVEGDTGDNAADLFVRQDNGAYYVAVFNFSFEKPASKEIRLDRIAKSLATARSVQVTDVWTNRPLAHAAGHIAVSLAPAESKLLKVTASYRYD